MYSDTNYASNYINQKSILVCISLIRAGPVFQESRKQSSVLIATTKAKYIAMSITIKQGQQIIQILHNIRYTNYIANNRVTIKTFGDNQRVIALAKNPHLTKRSKYINISYYFIRDL